MKSRLLLSFALACGLCTPPVQASSRVIVRLQTGSSALLTSLCPSPSCILTALGDPSGKLFSLNSILDLTPVLQVLAAPGLLSWEPDLLVNTADASHTAPAALTDTAPATYYGQSVPHGYISQPAVNIIRLPDAQSAFGVTGAGVVAVIDTGVDPNHQVLSSVLLPGYDFTRNQEGASELRDVSFSESPQSGPPSQVNGKTVAAVSQSTAAVVDGSAAYGDFGHGTMVAGVIHLVAPTARILPLKAFRSDGTGYLSDILRAIYTAGLRHVQVINMSFNFASYSSELATAIRFVNGLGIICVAAAGNDGLETLVYPAALAGLVIGVASTTDTDQRSSFSNYGRPLVWIASPGEAVVTTYPFGTFAAAWGTSFSTPMAAGAAALLFQLSALCDQPGAAQAVAHAAPIESDLGNGRLDVYQAVQAWRQMLRLP